MMGNAPEVRRMSISLKQMRTVKIEDQEASWASEADREMSRTIGSTGAMPNATRQVGDEVVRTAQQAVHVMT